MAQQSAPVAQAHVKSERLGSEELRLAVQKICQGLADLQLVRDAIVPTHGHTSLLPGGAEEGLVLDLSATDDDEDLISRLRRGASKCNNTTELDLSGCCPSGPDKRKHARASPPV